MRNVPAYTGYRGNMTANNHFLYVTFNLVFIFTVMFFKETVAKKSLKFVNNMTRVKSKSLKRKTQDLQTRVNASLH